MPGQIGETTSGDERQRFGARIRKREDEKIGARKYKNGGHRRNDNQEVYSAETDPGSMVTGSRAFGANPYDFVCGYFFFRLWTPISSSVSSCG